MTLPGRLDSKKGARERAHLRERWNKRLDCTLAVLFANVSIIYYSALLQKKFDLYLIYKQLLGNNIYDNHNFL